MKIERVELRCRCDDGGQQHYTASPRNAAAMAGSAAARNVATALVGNALQLTTFLRCCSLQHCYDTAAATRWTSQRFCNGQQRGAATVTRWILQWCCDGRQCGVAAATR